MVQATGSKHRSHVAHIMPELGRRCCRSRAPRGVAAAAARACARARLLLYTRDRASVLHRRDRAAARAQHERVAAVARHGAGRGPRHSDAANTGVQRLPPGFVDSEHTVGPLLTLTSQARAHKGDFQEIIYDRLPSRGRQRRLRLRDVILLEFRL